VFKFGECLVLCTLRFLILLYCISCHIGDNVLFKFGGMNKYYLFVCLFACFVLFICLFYLFLYIIFFCFAMLLIRHDLHHNCGLCVIGVFNLFEHCISLKIPVFYSCVGLKRLHLFD
jgi:hypothetical protein